MTTKNDVFDVTSRPKQYISGQKYLQKIEEAVFPIIGDDRCHIVFIKGEGGMGKTRLLEETMRRLHHKEMVEVYGSPQGADDWLATPANRGRVIVSNLIDFIDIRLHDQSTFRGLLGDRLTWNDPQFTFGLFEAAKLRATRRKQAGVSYELLEESERESEKAFWADYAKISSSRRVVIPLDTAEQLAFLTSSWLVQNDLLTSENLKDSTEQWLIKNINEGHFKNSTLIIAGRKEEGTAFFKKLERSLDSNEVVMHHIGAESLTIDGISGYFQALRREWQTSDKRNAPLVVDTLNSLLDNREKLEVLNLYTGGQPVRLALYIDLLIEANVVPAPLNDTYAKAKERVQRDGLDAVRQQIEKEFVNLLFRRPGRRAQILQILVRATRGLTAKQIHYILFSQPKDDPIVWERCVERSEKKQEELAEIVDELTRMTELAIFKYKERAIAQEATGAGLGASNPTPKEARYGLQDEIYRIYCRCVEVDKETEIAERKALYETIIRWIEPRRLEKEMKRRELVQEQLRDFVIEGVERILHSTLRPLPLNKDKQRREVIAELEALQLEQLHYQMLLAPYKNFPIYLDLDVGARLGGSGLKESLYSAEVARTLAEDYVMAFVPIDVLDYETFDSDVDSLKRFFEQYQVAHWLMMLGAQRKFDQVFALYERVEKRIRVMQEAEPDNYRSWTRPWIQGERQCWLYRAKVMSGDFETKELEQLCILLEKIAKNNYPDEAVPDFRGDPRQVRLVFVIAQLYNLRGYAKTQKGLFRTAVELYTRAEQYLRSQRGLFMPEMANILNNKSRALAELGLRRAIRIALDALQLRLEQGILDAITLSYNTIGLIHNLLYLPEGALKYCVRAYALAREIGNEHHLMLVHIELATALRRYVRTDPTIFAIQSIEEIFRQAQTALERAFEHASRANSASVPLLRIHIEQGCLYRDWHNYTDESYEGIGTRQEFYRLSITSLQQATHMGAKLSDVRLKLDACINLAWSHYNAGLVTEAEAELREAVQAITELAPRAIFQKDEIPPEANDKEGRPNYLFKHLSKAEGLRGRIAFDQWLQTTQALEQQSTTNEWRELKTQTNQFLENSARSYAFATSYAEVFSAHSADLTLIYNPLYEYLKKRKDPEFRLYYRYDKETRLSYRLKEIRLRDEGDTEGFLLDSFGDYYDDPTLGLERESGGDDDV